MVGLQTLDLAIGVRVPASQPNRIKQLRAAQKPSRPFCVPIVCQPKFVAFLCASFREEHVLQRVESALLLIWHEVRISIHCESDRSVTESLAKNFRILIPDPVDRAPET